MKDLRVIFMGTPVFACSVLEALIEEKYNVVLVVSQPDKPVGRHHQVVSTPVHELADKYGIPVLQPERLKEEAEKILEYAPDLIVTCAYGQFVPEVILNYPEYGCLNIHPSLLPKYRGGAPVHHAVWNGDTETGVALMEMIKKMDAGRVYAVTRVPIGPDETTEELNLRLMEVSKELIRNALPEYLEGKLPGIEQEEEKATIARNISKEDECISFMKEDLHQVYNHIRALIDWPVAYARINNKRLKIYRAEICEGECTEETGKILGFRDGAMEVACTGGILRILELQPEGKKRMKAADFANGAGRSLIGSCFE
ncbi:MAG: methionyl-tRNA formyltransferase [Solobacterium sp.]|nr:methionyl-tRNA formyltransferase [Solobacterium sp.]